MVDGVRHRVEAVQIRHHLRELVIEVEVDAFAGTGTNDERLNRHSGLDVAILIDVFTAEVHDRGWVIERAAVASAAVVDQLAARKCRSTHSRHTDCSSRSSTRTDAGRNAL